MGAAMTVSTDVIVLASSGDGGAGLFGLILFAAPFVVGWLTYAGLYKRYRNQDQRYQFEHTTSAVRSNLARQDTFVRARKRLRSSSMEGRNDRDPHQRAAHATVREAEGPRLAQAARQAQEPRMAQEPREAAPAREAQAAREDQPARDAQAPREAGPAGRGPQVWQPGDPESGQDGAPPRGA